MKVKVEFTIDVDIQDMRLEYDPDLTRQDVKDMVTETAIGSTISWLEAIGVMYSQ